MQEDFSKSQYKLSSLRKSLIRMYAKFRRITGLRRGIGLMRHLYPERIRKSVGIEEKIKYLKKFELEVNTQSWIEWKLFMDGVYEPHLHTIFAQFVKQGDTVLDVGANIGVHTLFLSQQVGDSGKVIAFEPYPPVVAKLRHNLRTNGIKNVTVLQLAASDTVRRVQIYNDDDSSNEGMASVIYQQNREEANAFEIEANTIDNVVANNKLDKIRLIKMDIQGSEERALSGAKDTIKRFRPYIIFEYDDSWDKSEADINRVLEFFKELDYTVYGLNENGSIEKVLINQYTELIATPNGEFVIGG